MSGPEIAEYLAGQRDATLASVGRDGFPHQAAMWFLPESDRLLMWTFRRSQKAVNLRRNPRASLLVQDGDTYDTLRGVSVQGEVELVEELDEVRRIGHALHQRYGAAYGPGEAYRGAVERQAPKRVGIVLPMTRVFSWDFRRLGRATG